MAFNTPFKMWKRYEFNGGTSDPCIISWPKGMQSRGRIRTQYHHAIDLVPTILDVLGHAAARDDQRPRPEPLRRREHALQLRRRVHAPGAGAPSSTRCSAPGPIWHEGWKAVTTHPRRPGGATSAPTNGSCTTPTSTAPSSTTSPGEHPGQLRELVNLWYAEAGTNGAFPLDDRSALELVLTPRPQLSPPRNRYPYYPDVAEVPESQAVNIRNRSYVVGALLSTSQHTGAEGVLFAHGSRFGGHALYVKDNRLHYVYNFVGIYEQKIVANEDVPTGENLLLSASFDKGRRRPRPASPPASSPSTTATPRWAKAA